jgi:hypothetical protein
VYHLVRDLYFKLMCGIWRALYKPLWYNELRKVTRESDSALYRYFTIRKQFVVGLSSGGVTCPVRPRFEGPQNQLLTPRLIGYKLVP